MWGSYMLYGISTDREFLGLRVERYSTAFCVLQLGSREVAQGYLLVVEKLNLLLKAPVESFWDAL